MTAKQGSKTLPLLAAAGGIGFAVHLLLGEAEPERQPTPERSAPAPAPQPESARSEVPPPSATSTSRRSAAVSPPAPDAQELDALAQTDPEGALVRLAQTLPHTERDAQRLKLIEVRALVAKGKVGAARGRAHEYFERWPNGPDTAQLQQLTGAHPTR